MVGYDQIATHRWMIRDSARTSAFREALMKTVAPGSAVLDVGAGTGILSLFAAQAGARVVYAVERAPIAALAAKLVESNGLSHTVRVVRTNIEGAELPERVDVIVSEWLGSIGINENLLLPVLLARDRWLKPGATIIPSVVTAYAAPACLSMLPDAAWFWDRPYGLDLSLLAEPSIHEQLCHPRRVVPQELAVDAHVLWRTDVRVTTVEQARLPARADITFELKDAKPVNALVAWFEAELAPGCVLSNSPQSPETHWGQLMLPFNRTIDCKRGDRLTARVVCIPSGAGQSQMAWSARLNDGPWEHHDTRVYPDPFGVPTGRRPVPPVLGAGATPDPAGPLARQIAPPPSANAATHSGVPPITHFLARLAVDPELLRQFLRDPKAVLNSHGVPMEDQNALLSRNAHAIESAMLRS